MIRIFWPSLESVAELSMVSSHSHEAPQIGLFSGYFGGAGRRLPAARKLARGEQHTKPRRPLRGRRHHPPTERPPALPPSETAPRLHRIEERAQTKLELDLRGARLESTQDRSNLRKLGGKRRGTIEMLSEQRARRSAKHHLPENKTEERMGSVSSIERLRNERAERGEHPLHNRKPRAIFPSSGRKRRVSGGSTPFCDTTLGRLVEVTRRRFRRDGGEPRGT